jgi:O-antigen ligase
MASNVLLFVKALPRLKTMLNGAVIATSLVLFLLCTAAWSINPASSARSAIEYGIVVIGAIGIAANLKADAFMEQLALLCFLSGAASLLLLAVSPAAAYGDAGDFRGIFPQKNVLGEAMTMGALGSLHGLRVSKRGRAQQIIFLIVDIIAAAKAQSATSCLTIAAFCATDGVIFLFRKGGAARAVAMVAIALAVPLMAVVAIAPDALLGAIGKDPTLTGRTDIWHYVVIFISQRPWLGWGYLAFWSTSNPAAMYIADALHWFAPQAHNGLLEMLLCVGVVGTACFILVLGRTVFIALQCLQTTQTTLAISTLLLCGGIVLVGVSETVLIDPFEASTGVFFVTGLFCERALRTAHARHVPAARVTAARPIPLRT